MTNRYLILRHGESKANVKRLIVSDPEEGIKDEHALTDRGVLQIKESIENTVERGVFPMGDHVLIITSPFSRTVQTADVAAETLKEASIAIEGPRIDDRLCERHFGELDFKATDRYHVLWQADKDDVTHEKFGAERVGDVLTRLAGLIADLERDHSDKTIVLVSHGDPLDILFSIDQGAELGEHKTAIDPIRNAEVRELTNTEKILEFA